MSAKVYLCGQEVPRIVRRAIQTTRTRRAEAANTPTVDRSPPSPTGQEPFPSGRVYSLTIQLNHTVSQEAGSCGTREWAAGGPARQRWALLCSSSPLGLGALTPRPQHLSEASTSISS